jgi:hypothetical protein
MFARKVLMHLKVSGGAEFKEKIEGEVIPLLRQQAGFLDEITFLCLGGREVHAFSLWETTEQAEAYNLGVYPQVKNMLAPLLEGTPRVQMFEVLNATIQKPLAAAAAGGR